MSVYTDRHSNDIWNESEVHSINTVHMECKLLFYTFDKKKKITKNICMKNTDYNDHFLLTR